MSLLRCSACFLVLFFAARGVDSVRTTAAYDLTGSRKSGGHLLVERSLKSIVEGGLAVGDVESVANRSILQKKTKDEPSEEEATESEEKEAVEEKPVKKEGAGKTDEAEPETDSEAGAEEEEGDETDPKTKATEPKTENGSKAKSKKEAEVEEEAEIDPKTKATETKTENGSKVKAKKEVEVEAEPPTDSEEGDEVGEKTEDDAEEGEKVVKTNSVEKEDSDAKSEEGGSKSSTKKKGKSVDKIPEKEKIKAEAEAETEPVAGDKDMAKTKIVKKVSTEKKEKSDAESDVEENESSTKKDKKSEKKSKKEVEAAASSAAGDGPDDGEVTDSATEKGSKKNKVNNAKKEKKNKIKMSKKEKKEASKKEEPQKEEPKKKPTPVVKKKVQPTLPSDCVWNNDSKSCFVDEGPFAKILSRTKSKSGKVLQQEYECLGMDQVSCNKKDGCEWLGSCHSTAYIKAESKCFGSASPFLYHMDGTCDRHSDQSSCSLNDKCTWLSDMEKCAVNFVKGFTGVTIDGEDVRNTRNARISELQSTFNVNIANFISNPDSILEWTLPDFNCPDGVDASVCEYAEVFDREFVLNVHCGTKYDITDISECNLDAFCEISIDGACGISPAMRTEVSRTGNGVLAGISKSSLGSKYIELINACLKGPSNVEGVGCEPGCLSDEDACIVDTDAYIQENVFKSKSFKSGQCKGFPLVHGDSGCDELEEDACEAKSGCSLDGDDVCIPNEKEIVLGALLRLERPVASAVKAASSKCASFKTESKCEKPKVL